MPIPCRMLVAPAIVIIATGVLTDALARPHRKVSASLTAAPTSIKSTQSSSLTWSSNGAVSCTGVNFWTGGLTSGTAKVTPNQTTTFSVSCTGDGASTTASTTVQVDASSMSFNDDFSSYSADTCMPDGTVFGPWNTAYAGYGCIKTITDSVGQAWLNEAPKASTKASETHAALSLGPRFSTPYTYNVRLNTVKHLRIGSAPNPWEVGWVVWNYVDDTHFYYVVLKPNGWELGKEDPAYPGAQRYLADGSSPKFPIGANYDVSITQTSSGTITVSVNGQPLVTFTDTERPYAYGHIGLYTEDASVNYTNVSVALPNIVTQLATDAAP